MTIDDVLTKNDCKNTIHVFGENTFESDDNDGVEEGEGCEVIVMICTANCVIVIRYNVMCSATCGFLIYLSQ